MLTKAEVLSSLFTPLSPRVYSHHTKFYTARASLRKDVPFEWSEDHTMTFNTLKGAITPEANMAYYDVTKPITREVDASQKKGIGLGAALVQEKKPNGIRVKTPHNTKTQSNYSNIERETLSLIHGVERFHTYLYGRSFTIITYHKPLEMICNKQSHLLRPACRGF